jgi:hypothetical protein
VSPLAEPVGQPNPPVNLRKSPPLPTDTGALTSPTWRPGPADRSPTPAGRACPPPWCCPKPGARRERAAAAGGSGGGAQATIRQSHRYPVACATAASGAPPEPRCSAGHRKRRSQSNTTVDPADSRGLSPT